MKTVKITLALLAILNVAYCGMRVGGWTDQDISKIQNDEEFLGVIKGALEKYEMSTF